MSNKPTHYLTIVNGDGDKAVFTRIAALWPTRTEGLAGDIPAGVTITGRVVILPVKANDQTA